MSEHTPGPWTLETNGPCWNLRSPDRVNHFLILVGMTDNNLGEREANARLIAAAPLGLEACKQALAELERLEDVVDACEGWIEDEPVDLCRRFIAQAKGGAR